MRHLATRCLVRLQCLEWMPNCIPGESLPNRYWAFTLCTELAGAPETPPQEGKKGGESEAPKDHG